MASGGSLIPPTPDSILFARNLFQALNDSTELRAKNHMVSPAGARSALTLVFMGAGVKSAEELRSGLLLGKAKKLEIAQQHAEFMSKECVCSEKGASMRLATGLFVNNLLELQADFSSQALEFFNVKPDTLSFVDGQSAMQHVNKWLQKHTFQTIRDLFTPAIFTPEASVVLVNSIYFRAKWAKRFAPQHTLLDDFWINDSQRMQLPMMRQVGKFRYGQSRKLKSRIVQLPFDESDLNMLLLVPFDIAGLPELEAKLQQVDLNVVAQKSVMHDCEVILPKFKLESDVDLKVPLQKVRLTLTLCLIHSHFLCVRQLGVKSIFESGQADLSGLLANRSRGLITEVRQKLYLNVNEAGCESDPSEPIVPATAAKDADLKVFKANHPFVFAIRNARNVYFVGHYVRP
ncbi:hypothetical protein KR093_008407 [Drosophila rubida]|uniref:Serpin domain-containing protein n=1 Tax=Drosophila rubida TaxID=30044 RepID=A0AAD4K121_9MUSC|nr:hypothetical protein KR093_008407 [Drosophila rubida]